MPSTTHNHRWRDEHRWRIHCADRQVHQLHLPAGGVGRRPSSGASAGSPKTGAISTFLAAIPTISTCSGDVTTLQVHLAENLKTGQIVTIRFGLLATPVKPLHPRHPLNTFVYSAALQRQTPATDPDLHARVLVVPPVVPRYPALGPGHPRPGAPRTSNCASARRSTLPPG